MLFCVCSVLFVLLRHYCFIVLCHVAVLCYDNALHIVYSVDHDVFGTMLRVPAVVGE